MRRGSPGTRFSWHGGGFRLRCSPDFAELGSRPHKILAPLARCRATDRRAAIKKRSPLGRHRGVASSLTRGAGVRYGTRTGQILGRLALPRAFPEKAGPLGTEAPGYRFQD